ncbi:MAG TPA: alpha/beta fold hydrolase [Polyangiaceae bacterium]|jgi:polyhydroxybutyrate depolymerase
MLARVSLASLLALTVGCSNTPQNASASDAGGGDASDAATGPFGRPYTLIVPPGLDGSTEPAPLLFMMHGYGATGAFEEEYMGLKVTAAAHGFLYAYADGTTDKEHKEFWNATDACCNFGHVAVDDVAYIDAVLADIESKHAVDPKRIFLVGHSNGAFMAHRYACDRADKIAGIVSLAGAQWEDLSKCQASGPVAVAQVHGDADQEIFYDGGATTDFAGNMTAYPSAHQTVADWATLNGCSSDPLADGGTLHLDQNAAGNETQVERYSACGGGTGVELWTIHGGMHIPTLGTSWGESIWAFLAAHPKP